MTERRKHSKVAQLPPAIRGAVHGLLISGKTIDEVIGHLKAMVSKQELAPGEAPSRSSVGRYAKGFLARMEKMDLVREQAKAIVERAEGQGLVVEEAAVSLVLNEIMTILMPEKKGNVQPKVVASVAMALAKLQSSSATRERAKIEIRKDMAARAKTAVEAIKKSKIDGSERKRLVEEVNGILLGTA